MYNLIDIKPIHFQHYFIKNAGH